MKNYIIFICLLSSYAYAESLQSLLPYIGRPGPLFAFGQNIVPKGFLFVGCNIGQLDGKNAKTTVYLPGALYGITDRISISFRAPYVDRHQDVLKSKGLGNMLLQNEIALIKHFNTNSVTRWTIVNSLLFDAPATNKELLLGRGTSYFIGTTLSHARPNWYFFTSFGAIPRSNKTVYGKTTRAKVRFGADIFYQAGISRTLLNSNGTYVAVLLEMSGIASGKDTINSTLDQNSGGNTIFLGPVLRWVFGTSLLQGGFQHVVYEKLNGTQNKHSFRFSISFVHGFNVGNFHHY